MRRLEGKAILVTGAARGLGRAIAQRCADEGAELVIIDVLEEEGARAADELRAKGCKIDSVRCDITRTETSLPCSPASPSAGAVSMAW